MGEVAVEAAEARRKGTEKEREKRGVRDYLGEVKGNAAKIVYAEAVK